MAPHPSLDGGRAATPGGVRAGEPTHQDGVHRGDRTECGAEMTSGERRDDGGGDRPSGKRLTYALRQMQLSSSGPGWVAKWDGSGQGDRGGGRQEDSSHGRRVLPNLNSGDSTRSHADTLVAGNEAMGTGSLGPGDVGGLPCLAVAGSDSTGNLGSAVTAMSGADTMLRGHASDNLESGALAATTWTTQEEEQEQEEVEDDFVTEYRSGAIYQLMEGRRLCFTCHVDDQHTIEEIQKYPKLFFFSSDLQERYQNFCADFGPVNLAIVRRFCSYVHEKYSDPRLRSRTIVYYTDDDPATRTNTAFLLGAYMMLCHRMTALEAYLPFRCLRPSPLLGYRDATFVDPPTFTLDVLDCFLGLEKAVQVGWFDVTCFSLDEYEHWDHPLNGDLHRLSPKFIGFKGPSEEKTEITPGFYTFTPGEYVQVFKDMNVTAIVRLNEPETYDKTHFEKAGFNFYDLEFEDCTAPSAHVVRQFLDICDKERGVVAVHCKAGLGRTGTLIALHMMKHQGFSAREAIAWLRICRPGSVIGPQQQFLEDCNEIVWDGNMPELPMEQGYSSVHSSSIASDVANAMNSRGASRSRTQELQGGMSV
eukprot:CAMPEP_0114174786 /NCGR_PEP_ID=MMETSP0043_2-20121206/36590_1 /TAXON_ID=464988 /ORGANISM="Hemiselmis andersenii, Strain CCMP644" /LENGTH=588 /DNA_ID=CAMNT_0001272943 /DNA_START=202 /DNA_END=1968 /DNA_ORIENTATION=-